MGNTKAGLSGSSESLPPAAALLRRPATRVRHEIMDRLREAGYHDILPAHLGVLQYPGPDGQRPGVLAMRNESSKQAMNHLLFQLEAGGYIFREQHPNDRRTRVVRLTERGRGAVSVIEEAVQGVDRAWSQDLGPKAHAELRRTLLRLEDMLGPGPDGS